MSRHPYEILADLLKHATRFCSAESDLTSPVPPGYDYPIFHPVSRLEESLAKSGGWCLHFWGEYGDRTSGMKPPADPLEVRRDINALGEMIKHRICRWGWRFLLMEEGISEVDRRLKIHRETKYHPLLDAALSWRLGARVKQHGTADALANEAESRDITPTRTPQEGERVIWDRHRQWYMSPALAETGPSISSEDHGELVSTCEQLSAYHARCMSPYELRAHQHKLELEVRETPYDLPHLGHHPNAKSDGDHQHQPPNQVAEPRSNKGGQPDVRPKTKILFLASNPIRMNSLALDEEVRAITAQIRSAEHRDTIELVSAWAVRSDDLQQLLLQHQPRVVHFSGHGVTGRPNTGTLRSDSAAGRDLIPGDTGHDALLILMGDRAEPQPVSREALVELFDVLKDNIRLVVLNACHTRSHAEAIAESVDCCIGMNAAIGDNAAIVFAAAFYRAIGFGRDVQTAYKLGKNELKLKGIPEERTPELFWRRESVDPATVVLVDLR